MRYKRPQQIPPMAAQVSIQTQFGFWTHVPSFLHSWHLHGSLACTEKAWF